MPEKEETGGAEGRSEQKRHQPGLTRRSLCLGIGGAAVMVALGGMKAVGSRPVNRPPGGQDEDRLIGDCIRCEKCVEVCPRHVVKLTHIEDGLVSMRTPTMDFDSDYCDFCQDENNGTPRCVQTCPTGALSLPADATPQNTVIGLAKITTDWCLAYKLLGCRYCYDACPYQAIRLDDQQRPVVVNERCNGCGACEAACVSLENGSISEGATARAITVQPLARE